MTELEKEATQYALEWGDKTDGTYACCRDAYLASAEPRETRIAELEAYNEKLLDGDIEKHNKIVELETQIEKMKCCGNCRFSESDKLNGTFCHREGCFVVASAKCKLWED